MLFVEPLFLFLFLPLTLFASRITLSGSENLRLGVLLVSGMVFYAVWSIPYLTLLLLSICFNYVIGGVIYRNKQSGAGGQARCAAVVAVIANLTLLGVFKYADFFLDTVNAGFSLNLILPLAISFYTFQQIAYVVDVYKGQFPPPRFLNYTAYVLFFPQLIAGPIVNYKDIQHDLTRYAKSKSRPKYLLAISYLMIGLAKKLLIADPLGGFLSEQQLVMSVGETTPLLSILTIIAYGLQLYFDFSAYGDMALGLGYLFGIQLPVNFDSPYRARNIAEFWRRWHITLGAFLRDYLFIPLGGSRRGMSKTLINMGIVMVLGGLWHGAAWGFVLWGALHGIALCVQKVFSEVMKRRRHEIALSKFSNPWLSSIASGLSQSITLVFVFLAWVPFYTESVPDAIMIWQSLLTYSGSIVDNAAVLYDRFGIEIFEVLLYSVVGSGIVLFAPNSHSLVRYWVGAIMSSPTSPLRRVLSHPLSICLYVPCCFVGVKALLFSPLSAFLYFQF